MEMRSAFNRLSMYVSEAVHNIFCHSSFSPLACSIARIFGSMQISCHIFGFDSVLLAILSEAACIVLTGHRRLLSLQLH